MDGANTRDGVNSGIGIVHASIPIPELELDLFMSKLGGIGIRFGIVHLGIGIGHFWLCLTMWHNRQIAPGGEFFHRHLEATK